MDLRYLMSRFIGWEYSPKSHFFLAYNERSGNLDETASVRKLGHRRESFLSVGSNTLYWNRSEWHTSETISFDKNEISAVDIIQKVLDRLHPRNIKIEEPTIETVVKEIYNK